MEACTHIQYLLIHVLNRLEEKAAVKRKENMKARVDRPSPGASWILSTTPRVPSNPQRLILVSVLHLVHAVSAEQVLQAKMKAPYIVFSFERVKPKLRDPG